jgi:hypothetical protein
VAVSYEFELVGTAVRSAELTSTGEVVAGSELLLPPVPESSLHAIVALPADVLVVAVTDAISPCRASSSVRSVLGTGDPSRFSAVGAARSSCVPGLDSPRPAGRFPGPFTHDLPGGLGVDFGPGYHLGIPAPPAEQIAPGVAVSRSPAPESDRKDR